MGLHGLETISLSSNKNMNKVFFSISPSSINSYRASQLLFFYSYIAKLQQDTETVQCYSKAGNVVHDLLERYALKKIDNLEKKFDEEWEKNELNALLSLNGKILSHEIYKQALLRGAKLLSTKYTNVKPEESIEFPLYEDDKFKIKLKGIIDVLATKNGKQVIVDYKTSSRVDAGEAFRTQGLFYAMLVYKRYGYVPEEVIFEYVKINQSKSYYFTEEQIVEFEHSLNVLVKEIVKKGYDVKNYDIGDEEELLNNPFNGYLQMCKAEIASRNTNQQINCKLKNNKLFFKSLPKPLSNAMQLKYSYFVPGYQFSDLFKSKRWDGKKSIFSKKLILPYALINDFQQLLADFNKFYKTDYKFNLKDERNPQIINATYKTVFKSSNSIELRDYQKAAIATAIHKKIGIIYIGTGGGKSFVAGEIIKQLNRRTLFLVNRLELVDQTHEVFEDYLGVKIGKMSEGNLDVSKQITVASIQTIYAILKRTDETAKQLKTYLANVTLLMMDECQNVSDSGIYGVVAKLLMNSVYVISLSGSPWRNN